MQFIRYETIVGDFTESVLRIENLEPKDSGDYLCNAVNGAAQTAVTRTNRLAVSKGKNCTTNNEKLSREKH